MTVETGALTESELNKVIAPEIKDDAFYRLIEKLAAEEKLKHVLEIGSSAGGGSTGAFLAGLARNKGRPNLFCVEVSKARFEVLRDALAPYAFAHCYNRSSVSVDEFPEQSEVIRFYNGVKTKLNDYPVAQVLEWLQQDIDYVGGAGVEAGAIEQIKVDHDISQFDMVLIDGSEFTGDAEFAKIDGARIILLDDTNTFKCFNVREHLLRDPDYELIADDQALRNGYSAFRRRDGRSKSLDLPIHFFTIVLNGEPFIRYHENVFASLTQRWHWHVVEGVAALKHDTAWSVEAGGRVADSVHDQGRSNDGTSAYLDDLARRFPDRMTVYRKPLGEFWDGKREMVAAPLPNIHDECLLWQIDADELWTAEQIDTVHAMFTREPDRTAAMYWCWYFVGPSKIISTRYNYAQNPQQEWLRTWRYKPGDSWFAHEPPILTRASPGAEPVDIAKMRPFTHDEMERAGAIFQHFAYAMESQLAFKETYYGYKDARTQWRQLQSQTKSGLLRDFLKWVPDETVFDAVEPYGVDLLAVEDYDGKWSFRSPRQPPLALNQAAIAVVLDGVIWQSAASEARRFWTGVLRAWARSGFADKVVVIDRGGTVPRIEGIHYWTVPGYERHRVGHDSLELERLSRIFAAQLFVSTAETTPTETASCLICFDGEEQLSSFDDSESQRASLHATAHIMVGAEPAQPSGHVLPRSNETQVVPPGVSIVATAETPQDPNAFRREHKLGSNPYVMVAGDQAENLAPVVAAASLLVAVPGDVVFFMALAPASVASLRAKLAPTADVRPFDGSDDAWLEAVAGAHALICPNLSAAPTLAALEGMASGCPVIMCGDAAARARAVLGTAVLSVGADDPVAIAASLRRLFDPSARQGVIAQGLRDARRFSMEQTASALAAALLQVDSGNGEGAARSSDRRGWVALRTHQKAEEKAREAAALSANVGEVETATGSPRTVWPSFLNWLTGRRQRSA